jgi:hypothetical protein
MSHLEAAEAQALGLVRMSGEPEALAASIAADLAHEPAGVKQVKRDS